MDVIDVVEFQLFGTYMKHCEMHERFFRDDYHLPTGAGFHNQPQSEKPLCWVYHGISHEDGYLMDCSTPMLFPIFIHNQLNMGNVEKL